MRAYLRARILLRIGASGAGPRLPARSRKLPRLWSRFFPVAATVILIAKAASSPIDPDACRSQVRSSSSLILFPDQFLFPRHGRLLHDLVVNLGFICSSGGGLDSQSRFHMSSKKFLIGKYHDDGSGGSRILSQGMPNHYSKTLFGIALATLIRGTWK